MKQFLLAFWLPLVLALLTSSIRSQTIYYDDNNPSSDNNTQIIEYSHTELEGGLLSASFFYSNELHHFNNIAGLTVGEFITSKFILQLCQFQDASIIYDETYLENEEILQEYLPLEEFAEPIEILCNSELSYPIQYSQSVTDFDEREEFHLPPELVFDDIDNTPLEDIVAAAAPDSNPVGSVNNNGAELNSVGNNEEMNENSDSDSPVGAWLEKSKALHSVKHKSQYPYKAIDFLSVSLKADENWAASIPGNYGRLHTYEVWSEAHTGLFSLATGKELKTTGTAAKSSRQINIAIAADWGAGTWESDIVQELMMKNFKADWSLHLGDVYYTSTTDEVKSNMLGMATEQSTRGVSWPHGILGSFTIMGNHEMISRGNAYFDTLLPTLGLRNKNNLLGPTASRVTKLQRALKKQGFTGDMLSGQEAGYWLLENEYWRIVGLDSGYGSYSLEINGHKDNLPFVLLEWLQNVVKISNVEDKRGIILLSHHQPNSAFQAANTGMPAELAQLIPKGREFIWLYGHEHRLSLYNKVTITPEGSGGNSLTYYGRCIGNGGFPTLPGKVPSRPDIATLNVYDNRVYDYAHGFKSIKVGFNGYIRLKLNENNINIQYFTPAVDSTTKRLSTSVAPTLLADETFLVEESTGNVKQTKFKAHPKLTKVHSHLS